MVDSAIRADFGVAVHDNRADMGDREARAEYVARDVEAEAFAEELGS
ncbi:hypothetical protein MPS_3943 [Mycobacterium pseudoshottsii JCM 15466]|nr:MULTISPECIES: hypothetical protein [Mycobacterium ulcerans group]GAQ37977.1 hypothetical protein MPS_3943 [Mycobacterium pseudoshottsii JCM 15466]